MWRRFAVYLLSDAARDINGQVFRVQGYEVGRLGMLRYAPVMTNLGKWDVDLLAERLPAELGPDLQPLPMPWPESGTHGRDPLRRLTEPDRHQTAITKGYEDGAGRKRAGRHRHYEHLHDRVRYQALAAPSIVLQEAFGVNDHIRDLCHRFAAAGYVAVAPHLFHRSGDPELGYEDMQDVMVHIMQLEADKLEADLNATFEFLASLGYEGKQVAVVGFCMGGSISFVAGCYWELGAAVTFYGGGIAQGRFGLPPLFDLAPTLKTPWLGLFGDLDTSIPVNEVEGLRGAAAKAGPDDRHRPSTPRPTTASIATPALPIMSLRPPMAGIGRSSGSIVTWAERGRPAADCLLSRRPAGTGN